MDYVRTQYRVPVKRGMRVTTIDGSEGTVTRATHYVYVRLDGRKHSRPYHPMDLTYSTPEVRDA